MVHGNTDSVITSKLVVAAASEKEGLAGVASTEDAERGKTGEKHGLKKTPFIVQRPHAGPEKVEWGLELFVWLEYLVTRFLSHLS